MRGAAGKLAWGMAVGLVLLGGCVVGPKYNKPAAPSASAYKELGAPNVTGGWKQAEPRDDAGRGKWWERFNDRKLNELEEKLNASNQGVAAAAANVVAARAMIVEARSQYWPAVAFDPSITGTRLATGFGKTLGITFANYSFPFDTSWELDLWGRIRNTVRTNTAAAQASVADLENIRLSAQAELAADYFLLRGQDALQQLLDATVRAYEEAFELTRDRDAAGLEADEAVAQAETQWKAARAQATNLLVLRAQYEHAMAVLAGQPASTFSIAVAAAEWSPPAIPVGVPSELLERRPDVASAERAVAEANAQVGVAKAAFFPAAVLGATLGFQGLSLANWLAWPNRVWSLGPSVAQTVFDAGLRKATVRQFQAAYDLTVANYRQTVLTAFQQVEDNLAALRVLAEVIGQQDSAVGAAARSLREAETRYQSGLDPYLNVITAQTALLANQQAAVNFRTQRMIASVQLIKALGGGWAVSQIPTPKELGGKIGNGPGGGR